MTIIATDVSLNRQVRQIRKALVHVPAVGLQSGEDTSHLTGGSSITGTAWLHYTCPSDTPGIVRFGFARLDGDTANHALSYVEWRQQGTDFSGLVLCSNGPRDLGTGLAVNCEGYAAGYDDSIFERAIQPGEHYYTQITAYDRPEFGPYTPAELDFEVQWYFEPLSEPYPFAASPSIRECSGPLHLWDSGPREGQPSKGEEIRYFLMDWGWPGSFLPGKVIPNTPPLPVSGHAFYVEEWDEALNVHYRGMIVGWTEESGPFFYSHLQPFEAMRTWDIDSNFALGPGACGPDGEHHVPYVAENPRPPGWPGGFGYELDTFRSTTTSGNAPTTNWGDLSGFTNPILDELHWGGAGRPDRFFGTVTEGGEETDLVREWDLDGNKVRDVTGLRSAHGAVVLPTICAPDGHSLYDIVWQGTFSGNWDVYKFDLNDDTLTLAGTTVIGFGNTPNIIGIRANGEIVSHPRIPDTIFLTDSATGTTRSITPPNNPNQDYFTTYHWWVPLGITSDSRHLFIGSFHPLDILPHPFFLGGSVGRRFVTDVHWIDLDTGESEFKFRLGHHFHDTEGVPDHVRVPQTTTPVDLNIRLKPTIPKVLQVQSQGVTEMSPR